MEYKKALVALFLFALPSQAQTGMAVVVATYDRIASTALPVTPIYVIPQTGLYRISGVATITAPGTGGTFCYLVNWVDGDSGAPISNGPACTNVATVGYGPNWVATFYAQKGTPVAIQTIFNNLTGTPSYDMHFQLEQF